jgi:hypothetical protein
MQPMGKMQTPRVVLRALENSGSVRSSHLIMKSLIATSQKLQATRQETTKPQKVKAQKAILVF